jgi:hypothetical protein
MNCSGFQASRHNILNGKNNLQCGEMMQNIKKKSEIGKYIWLLSRFDAEIAASYVRAWNRIFHISNPYCLNKDYRLFVMTL